MLCLLLPRILEITLEVRSHRNRQTNQNPNRVHQELVLHSLCHLSIVCNRTGFACLLASRSKSMLDAFFHRRSYRR